VEEKRLVPKRRFEKFKDNPGWKIQRLGNLAKIVRGASPRPIQDPKWFHRKSDIGWLRISDVTEQNGRINYLGQRLSKLGQEKTRVLTEPHLLLSIAATVGKPVVNYVKTGVHDGFLIFLKPQFDREFMFQWLEMFRPLWNKYGQPGSQVNLNSDIVKEQKIILPNIKEQQKIGNFLKKIDDTIALQQRKLEKAKTLKSAYLAEMFPAEGERVPKRRFAGFTDEWERKKLEDIAETFSGGTPNANDPKYYNGNIPFIRSGEINSDKTGLFITESALLSSSAKLVKKGDILYALYGATSGEVGISKINGAINQAVLAIKPKDTYDSYFIIQWLKKHKTAIINSQLQGGQGNLSGSIVRKLMIDLPTPEEQIKIGEFFKNIDEMISNHQNKLNKLKSLKQAYLHEMFV
jgi:type I restriction enzyme S subunit